MSRLKIGCRWLDLEKLQKACRGCIAKTEKKDKEKETKVEAGLPLWMHLTDTAAMMNYIFTQRVSQQEKDQLRQATHSDEITRSLFILLGGLHDIGKASAIFQSQLLPKLELENEFSLPLISDKYRNSEANHTRLGVLILCSLGYRESLASVCGAHHGRTQNLNCGKANQIIYNEAREWLFGINPNEQQIEDWKKIWRGISDSFLEACGFSDPKQIPELEPHQLMMLAGYLSAADWLASNPTYFPLIEKTNFDQEIWYPERITTGQDRIGFPAVWFNSRKEDNPNFQTLFGLSHPYPFQQAVLEVATSIDQPGLMIIEAPMGSGKTEAALMAADIFTKKAQSGGVFIGLPTQATANGLLKRFKSWAEKESNSMTATFMLSHEAATLNSIFQNMPRTESLMDEDGDETGKLVIHKWMEQNRLRLFSDFVIGTVDQALMAALDCRYVTLRHVGLAGKTLVLDEIHAYDDYTSRFITILLTWMGHYNAPVILLSATLPEEKRAEFIKAYLKGLNKMKKVKNSTDVRRSLAYPRITWTNGLEVYTKDDLGYEETCKVQILKEEVTNDQQAYTIKKQLEKHLTEGGCAGVVVNTIRKAQDFATYLQTEMPTYQIVTIHSAYRRQDRQKLEDELLERLGKDSTPEQRNRLIVVGTQVIEQSLDIDFDFMISELAPVDVLLQRMGRLFRHKGRNRPKSLTSPLFVLLDTPKDTVDSSSKKIYGEWPLRQSRKVLSSEILLPDDIPTLIKQAYEKPVNEDEAWKEYSRVQEHEEKKANQWMLNPPMALKSTKLKGLNGLMKAQSLDTEEQAQISVRDGGPSTEVFIFTSEDPSLDQWTSCDIRNYALRTHLFEIDEFSKQIEIWMENNEKLIEEKIQKEFHKELVLY
ncbi:MAG: CRISPR-associated helicase Cas3', partial [Allobaculum sp.]|nr:CRISPR-associated helicase Cas3' [Allobaculum sp.]